MEEFLSMEHILWKTERIFLKQFRKTFQIDKFSSISWDGDPFNPALNITANYYRTVSNATEYLGVGICRRLM